jgi:hypothetical protein
MIPTAWMGARCSVNFALAVLRFRAAVEAEPVLQMGRGMTEEMAVFLRRARDPA